VALLLSLCVYGIGFSGEFLTKTTVASSQEVVEGWSWYFLKRIRSWELNQIGFWIYIIRRNLKNKHDLKRAGVKKGVRPCICLYIDSIFTWIVTRPCGCMLLIFLVFCVILLCVYVLSSVLWCPNKNDVRFVFISSCL